MEAGQDLNNFCRRLSGQFRNLMVLKSGITDTALLGIPESMLPDLRQQADLFSREDLLRLFDAFQKIETGMKYATQVRFQLEMGLIELAHITRLRSLEDLIAEFTEIAGGGTPQQPDASTKHSVPSSAIPTPRPVSPRPRPKRTQVAPSTYNTPATPERDSASRKPSVTTRDNSPASGDPRELLLEIAAAVGREPLESLLVSLEGAQLQGNRVVLEPGAIKEFVRRQIKENLPDISQAAAKIVGRAVTVKLNETAAEPVPDQNPAPEKQSEGDLLEKAKREPVVKSFLDVFPGPVTAEKLDK